MPSTLPGDVLALELHVQRRRSADSYCVCCDGQHVYGYYLTETAEPEFLEVDWYMALWTMLRRFPDGTRIRIAITEA